MPATYWEVKAAAIKVADRLSRDRDVSANYGTKYKADTKLAKLGIGAEGLSTASRRFNAVLRHVVGKAHWQPVGPFDLVACKMIGDFILLACGQSGTTVPKGEPQ